MRIAKSVSPSAEDLQWLRKQANSAVAPRRLTERCRIVLLAIEGQKNEQIAATLGITRQKAARWRTRFAESDRAGGENDAPGRGRKPIYGPEIEALIVKRTLRTLPPQATHWSQRSLAKALDVSDSTVGRVWRAHGLKPHLVRTFKVSNDPRFIEKLEDVIGLYLNAPEHAIVLCCDEKSQVQALDRTQPGLPLKKGRAGTMTHDYVCRNWCAPWRNTSLSTTANQSRLSGPLKPTTSSRKLLGLAKNSPQTYVALIPKHYTSGISTLGFETPDVGGKSE